MNRVDIAVIGAGAAGLMAAIFASRGDAGVMVFEGAAKVGAKILISGGGRCNVTHDVVLPEDFNGSRNAIAKVLRTFTVEETVAFFESLGVALKREETGKLFPVTDRARSVLDALLTAAGCAAIATGARVESVERRDHSFLVTTSRGSWEAKRVILAAGGRSVPKTGSDGSGYALARSLGHSVTELFPALVPLVLPGGHWLTALSGASVEAELSVRSGRGRVLRRERGSMLFTHFGLSGPVVLDISRHWLEARAGDAGVALVASMLPGETFESVEAAMAAEAKRNPRATVASFLRPRLSERLAVALAAFVATDSQALLGQLTRDVRRSVVRALVELPLPVVRDRGFDFAEVTAGGVPLSEIDLATMESRLCPGLYICGEILDVDGKIGGYNFQWAWASGRLAGAAAARAASVT